MMRKANLSINVDDNIIALSVRHGDRNRSVVECRWLMRGLIRHDTSGQLHFQHAPVEYSFGAEQGSASRPNLRNQALLSFTLPSSYNTPSTFHLLEIPLDFTYHGHPVTEVRYLGVLAGTHVLLMRHSSPRKAYVR